MGRLVILLTILFYIESYSQYIPFKLSTDNTPSTIYQTSPRIYQKPDGNYIAAWTDMREGNTGYYSQEFTEDLIPIGGNVKTHSDLKRVYWNNDDYVMLGEIYEHSRISDITTYSLNAYINQSDDENQLLIGSSWMPFCGTGWLGISNDLIPFQNSFILAYRFGEELSIYRYDLSGTLISSNLLTGYESDNDNSQALAVELVSLPEVYIVSWASCEFNETNFKYNINIYNSNDSLLLSLSEFDSATVEDYYTLFENNNTYKIAAVDDTSFVFAYFDSLELKIMHLSVSGDLINSYSYKIDGDFSYDFYYSLDGFCLSIVDNKIKLLLQIMTYHYAENIQYKEYLIDVNFASGEITDDINIVDGAIYFYGDEVLSTGDSTLLAGLTRSNDVYAVKVRQGEIIDSLKLNDDASGSNEYSTSIVSGNERFICTWQDELRRTGINVDDEGNKLSGYFEIPTYNFFMLSNNDLVSLVRTNAGYDFELNLKIWDEVFNPKADYHLFSGSNSSSPTSNILEYEDYIYFAFGLGQGYKFVKCDKNYEVKSEKVIETDDNVSYLRLHFNTDKDFWLTVNNTPINFNTDFELLQSGNATYYDSYISPGKFLRFNTIYADSSYLQFLSYLGDTLSTVTIDDEIVEHKVQPLNDNEFAVVYLKDSKINLIVLNNELKMTPRIKSLLGTDQFDIKNISTGCDGNNLLIAYSARETENSNYDIFALSISLDDITKVERISSTAYPDNYELSNNYPNPFNPVTNISYSIPPGSAGISGTHVKLVIFDILGREVATLVNEEQNPGKYTVEFDASEYASGLYMYSLTAGNFKSIKKMILIK